MAVNDRVPKKSRVSELEIRIRRMSMDEVGDMLVMNGIVVKHLQCKHGDWTCKLGSPEGDVLGKSSYMMRSFAQALAKLYPDNDPVWDMPDPTPTGYFRSQQVR